MKRDHDPTFVVGIQSLSIEDEGFPTESESVCYLLNTSRLTYWLDPSLYSRTTNHRGLSTALPYGHQRSVDAGGEV